jgi:acetyltransferase
MSHTGSIAGNYRLLKAALKQAGVTFLDEGGQMPHAMKTLLNLPLMQGNRIGVITYSGGAGIMVSDSLEKHNLRLAAFSAETIDRVAALSPQWLPLTNPLDIWSAVMVHGARQAYSVALKAVLNDPNVDGIICIALAPPTEFSVLDVSETLNTVLDEFPTHKPVIVWTYGPNAVEAQKRFESRNRIMVYPTLELATWALSLLRDRYKAICRGRQS